MAYNDSDMDWQADEEETQSSSRPRGTMIMAMSNAIPIRTEFGYPQHQNTLPPGPNGEMQAPFQSFQTHRTFPMTAPVQQAAARREFVMPVPSIREPSAVERAAVQSGNWPTQALGILAAEIQSEHKGTTPSNSFAQSFGATKRFAEDDLQRGEHGHITAAANRVKAQIKRPKNMSTNLEGPSAASPAPVVQMSLEETYDRFWANDRQFFQATSYESEATKGNQNVYSPLTHDDSIRLLCLDAGKDSSLSCRLVSQRLSQLEYSYEAISYVWGDPDAKVGLHTSGGVIGITKNLHAFLQHLRFDDRPRYLWADAACIDQSNVAERNHQVSSMKQIYTRASDVVIWLGPDTSNKAKMAFSVICSVASGGVLNGRQLGQAHFYSNGVSSANIPDLPCRDDPPKESFTVLWHRVQELFDKDWFWRIWCIQEATLAKSALIHWGCCQIPWTTLGLAAARLRTGQSSILRRYPMPGVFNAYFMYRVSVSQTTNNNAGLQPLKLSFLKLLALTGQFGVTDPRDRVFGLLGMPTTDTDQSLGETYIKPDYSLTTQQVYETLVEKALAIDRITGDFPNLALILASVQHKPSNEGMVSPTSAAPSWIPQWGEHRTSLLLSWESGPMLQAHSPVNIGREPRLTLSITGVVCTSIAGIAQIAANPLTTNGLEHYFHAHNGRTVLAMTLTAGKQWYGIPADVDEHLSDFDAYYRKQQGFNSPHESAAVDRFAQAVQNAVPCRMLFSTQWQMQLGLGPDVARVGDEIVLLEGAVTPFILRRVHDSSINGGIENSVFQLVGECYVHGIVEAARQAGRVLERLSII